MADRDLQLISVFFLYTFLDEKLALRASRKVFRLLKEKKENSDLVAATWSVWKSHRRFFRKDIDFDELDKEIFKIEEGTLKKWSFFRQRAIEDEFLAVIWSQLLKIPEKEISRGLGVSERTVRYRVGRGLVLLGEGL